MQPKIGICSICSREKDPNPDLLLARERYLGTHVAKVGQLAIHQEVAFFILSGVYGLLAADEAVPYYDHLLVDSEVSALVKMIRIQLWVHEIKELSFYTKSKPNWLPYRRALEEATTLTGTKLHIYELSDDD